TRVPPNVVGNGSVVATSVSVASPRPNAATMDSVASPPRAKLAAETPATGAACTTLTSCPATVSVPRREPGFGFAETTNFTVPLPLPLAPTTTVMNGSLLTAVQTQPSPALTMISPSPTSGWRAWLTGAAEMLQAGDSTVSIYARVP